MAISILCPGCTVQLGLPDEAVGATVACPRCGTNMRVPRPASPPVPPPPPPRPRDEEKPRPRRLERDEEPDDEDDEPERPRKKRSSDDRPKRKKKKEEDTSGIWVGIAIGAGVVFATIIAAVFLAQEPEKKRTPEPPSNVTIVPYGANPDGSINNPNGGPAPAPIPGTGPALGSGTRVRPALPPGWVECRHPDGAWTIYAPGQLRPEAGTEHAVMTKPIPTGLAWRSKFSLTESNMYCEVVVMAYSPELVEGVRNAHDRSKSFLPIPNPMREPVTWAGRSATQDSGTEETTGGNSRLYVQRWMFIGNRLYSATMHGVDGRPTPEEQSAFFDSLVPGK